MITSANARKDTVVVIVTSKSTNARTSRAAKKDFVSTKWRDLLAFAILDFPECKALNIYFLFKQVKF